jgi:hypothetical protein
MTEETAGWCEEREYRGEGNVAMGCSDQSLRDFRLMGSLVKRILDCCWGDKVSRALSVERDAFGGRGAFGTGDDIF